MHTFRPNLITAQEEGKKERERKREYSTKSTLRKQDLVPFAVWSRSKGAQIMSQVATILRSPPSGQTF
jgi:hypothetical protein